MKRISHGLLESLQARTQRRRAESSAAEQQGQCQRVPDSGGAPVVVEVDVDAHRATTLEERRTELPAYTRAREPRVRDTMRGRRHG